MLTFPGATPWEWLEVRALWQCLHKVQTGNGCVHVQRLPGSLVQTLGVLDRRCWNSLLGMCTGAS